MSLVNPSILPGFMELLPEEQKLFDKVKNTIEKNFIKYGFVNIDTPLIEKEEILLSKGGGETSKQIYRIDKDSTAQALRFDLTVSLARYVSMYSNDLNFPFKRYQVGKVYRGERNQKGRYREFYQCDIDIVGNENLSIINDAELPAVIFNIFNELEITNLLFRINNRKLLGGFLESIQVFDFEGVLRTIDKLEKIGEDKTREELLKLDISNNNIDEIFKFIKLGHDNESVLTELDKLDIGNDTFKLGLEELKTVYTYMKKFGVNEENIKIDLTITRGLDYYTGTVFETFLIGYENIGSVCSGGRYDSLANNFSKRAYPGVGLSIGLTRLFYQLNEAKLLGNIKSDIQKEILILPMDQENIDYGIEVLKKLRENSIKADIYLEKGKAKKKFAYADKLGVNYTIIVGEKEENEKLVTFKDFESGKQDLYKIEEVIEIINGGDL